MKKLYYQFFLFLLLTNTQISCNKEFEEPLSLEEQEARIQINVMTVAEGYDGEKVWFQPRVCQTESKKKKYVLLMQPWYTKQSDLFGMYHCMYSEDGNNWNEPVAIDPQLADRFENHDSILVRIADVNTQFHTKSHKILAIGGVVRYNQNGKQIGPVSNTCFFSYDPRTETWEEYQMLNLPKLKIFDYSYPGCSQWVENSDGSILIPLRMYNKELGRFSTTVLHCQYDGKSLSYIQHGNILEKERGRGLFESSLIDYKGRYYLTMRNDSNGMVSVSKDGLIYSDPIEWKFDNDSLLNSENTQQHWLRSPYGLYLVYTSSQRPENHNVLRGRAPLYMARFDEERMVLLKSTEKVVVGNTGAQLGNFGTLDIGDNESWVITSEGTTAQTQEEGNNNGRVYIAKIKWK